ncbi:MAG TPA: hypothetical protein VGI50_06615 [Solirubrobacteraceae bacterium]
MGRPSRYASVLGIVGLVVAAGGAYAVASSRGGTITVCVSHKSGALYRASRCGAHDNRLTWNRQGPAGPQGPKGQPGSAGVASTWALVSSAGNVLSSSPSWGTNTVSRLAPGVYCLKPGTAPFWISPNYTGGHPVTAEASGGSPGCNGPYSHVYIYDTETGTAVDDSFVIFIAQ